MRALVLASGELVMTPQIERLARSAEWVVAADGGVRYAERLALVPDLLVGDFDSATARELARFAATAREEHPAAKDRLDLELAIQAARSRGADRVVVLGALGGRLDQTLAAVLIAARWRERGLAVTLHSGLHDLFALGAGDAQTLDAPSGTTFSLLSLKGDATVSARGARYPLDDDLLPFGVGLGVSNLTTERETVVSVRRGLVALVLERNVSESQRRDLG